MVTPLLSLAQSGSVPKKEREIHGVDFRPPHPNLRTVRRIYIATLLLSIPPFLQFYTKIRQFGTILSLNPKFTGKASLIGDS